MTIELKTNRSERPVLDLTGPDGNAMVLLARAKGYAYQLGLDYEPIQKAMMSGDYKNLIAVFEQNFGEYVTLLVAGPREDEQ